MRPATEILVLAALPPSVVAMLISDETRDVLYVAPYLPEGLWIEIYDLCAKAPEHEIAGGRTVRSLHVAPRS